MQVISLANDYGGGKKIQLDGGDGQGEKNSEADQQQNLDEQVER